MKPAKYISAAERTRRKAICLLPHTFRAVVTQQLRLWVTTRNVGGSSPSTATVGLLSKAHNPMCSRSAISWLTLGSALGYVKTLFYCISLSLYNDSCQEKECHASHADNRADTIVSRDSGVALFSALCSSYARFYVEDVMLKFYL